MTLLALYRKYVTRKLIEIFLFLSRKFVSLRNQTLQIICNTVTKYRSTFA